MLFGLFVEGAQHAGVQCGFRAGWSLPPVHVVVRAALPDPRVQARTEQGRDHEILDGVVERAVDRCGRLQLREAGVEHCEVTGVIDCGRGLLALLGCRGRQVGHLRDRPVVEAGPDVAVDGLQQAARRVVECFVEDGTGDRPRRIRRGETDRRIGAFEPEPDQILCHLWRRQ